MAIVPIISLLLAVLLVVLAIFPVILRQIGPIDMILAVVPVVVVLVVAVIDADLDDSFLRLRRSYNQPGCDNDGGQQQRANISIDEFHRVIPQFRDVSIPVFTTVDHRRLRRLFLLTPIY